MTVGIELLFWLCRTQETAYEPDEIPNENNEDTIKMLHEAARQILLRNIKVLMMGNFNHMETDRENLDLHTERKS